MTEIILIVNNIKCGSRYCSADTVIQCGESDLKQTDSETAVIIDQMRMLLDPVLLIVRDKASASFDLAETHQALMEIYGNGRPLQIHFA